LGRWGQRKGAVGAKADYQATDLLIDLTVESATTVAYLRTPAFLYPRCTARWHWSSSMSSSMHIATCWPHP